MDAAETLYYVLRLSAMVFVAGAFGVLITLYEPGLDEAQHSRAELYTALIFHSEDIFSEPGKLKEEPRLTFRETNTVDRYSIRTIIQPGNTIFTHTPQATTILLPNHRYNRSTTLPVILANGTQATMTVEVLY